MGRNIGFIVACSLRALAIASDRVHWPRPEASVSTVLTDSRGPTVHPWIRKLSPEGEKLVRQGSTASQRHSTRTSAAPQTFFEEPGLRGSVALPWSLTQFCPITSDV